MMSQKAITQNTEEQSRKQKAVADIPHVMPRPFFQPFLIVFDDLYNTLILCLHERTPYRTLCRTTSQNCYGQVITHRSGESQCNVTPDVFHCRALLLEELGSSGVLWIQGVLGLAVPDME